jgi:DNA-binding response OmpR family regulator
MKNHYIIAVDDDIESLELVITSLTAAGYGTKAFEDGLLAWLYLQNNVDEISVIILAKTLPNIAGMELLQKIQKHPQLKKIPVIIQTVDSEDGKYKNAIEQGAQFYLNKPLDAKQIIRFVKAAIRSRNNNSDDRESFVDKVKK